MRGRAGTRVRTQCGENRIHGNADDEVDGTTLSCTAVLNLVKRFRQTVRREIR